MRFETQVDLDRETKAIKTFCDKFDLQYQKLGDHDVDFKILKNKKVLTFVEVKGRLRNIDDCYPLPIAIRKVYKLCEAHKDPVIIWSCNDGLLYAKLKKLKGDIRQGGRTPRKGSHNDIELMAYYNAQESIKTIKY